MKTTKWMRTSMLAVVTLLVGGVVAVLACGPAATPEQKSSGAGGAAESVSVPATEAPFVLQQSGGGTDVQDGQEGDPTVEPTPTATRDPDRREIHHPTKDEMVTICPPPGPRNIEQTLRREYNAHMEEEATRQARGESAEPVVVEIIVATSTVEAVDEVVKFLNANGARVFSWNKEGDVTAAGGVYARVNVELLFAIGEIEGVSRVEKVRPHQPASFNRQGSAGSAVRVAQADQWHRAGFTGAGVGVGIIDFDFRNFRSRIPASALLDVEFFCYDANGVVFSGTLVPLTTTALAPCERADVPAAASPHGTDVASALAAFAPDAKLYISNANTLPRLVEATNWLLAQDDVKVINRSAVAPWDGPGDGTSPFDMVDGRSPLRVVEDAVEQDVLWVNAAGNGARRTWFMPNIVASNFDNNNYLKFNSSGNFETCNRVILQANTSYTFQMRWNGTWPRADIDLNVHLFGPVDPVTGTGGAFLFSQMDPQSGGATHYPRELFDFTLSSTPAGTYCLYVSREPADALPTWVQLQMFSSNGTLTPATAMGSIDNPAESNEEGMLSVGATDGMGNRVENFSAQGPAPEPPGRQVLDLVSPGGNPNLAGSSGTSFAAPRVAGESALVIQALGDRDQFDEPDEVAWYMKWFGSTRRTCDHEWGCGFAILAPLDPPTNVRLELTSNACEVGSPRARLARNIRLSFDPVSNDNPDVSAIHYVRVKKATEPDPDPDPNIVFTQLETVSHLGVADGFVAGGETYQARAYTCAWGGTEGPICGPVSEWSNELAVPSTVCTPVVFDQTWGDEMTTPQWNAQPDATAYDVRRVDENDNPLPGAPVTVTDQRVVFDELTNFDAYRFQVRARGPSGTSAWSETVVSHPRSVAGGVTPISLIGGGQDWPRQYDAGVAWLHGGLNAWYEVRVRQTGSSDPWVMLSSDPEVAGEGPRVIFLTDPDFGGGPRRVRAFFTGLLPGTEYDFQVRGVNGSVSSPGTGTTTFTTVGQRLAEVADRPTVPEGLEVMVNASEPFQRVVLGWDTADDDYLHEIRVMGGGIDTWRRLPHQPAGWSPEYSVKYPTDGQAFITNLIPGTEYHFAVRVGRVRDSSEMLDRSPWSEVVTLTTPGIRPAGAPGEATAPALKAPPEDLMAEVDGTTVNLSWTAGTNPNYVRQEVWRREAGVTPLDWTEIAVGLNDTSYADTGLVSGKQYVYRIRAEKANGRGGESNAVTVTVE